MLFEESYDLIKEILDCNEIDEVIQLKGGCTTDVFKVVYDNSEIRVIKFEVGKDAYDRFSAEYSSLNILTSVNIIRSPKAYKFQRIKWNNQEAAVLVIEYIKLHLPTPETCIKLARQLSKLHIRDSGNQFGFIRPTYIGTTKQDNTWNVNWIKFYSERIRKQLTLFKSIKGYDQKMETLIKKVIDSMSCFFPDINDIKPSLLHGDLWTGNWKADENGDPVVFDPAMYFGHNEAELSIMSMFGDLGQEFYSEYFADIKRSPYFPIREKLYQLYHYLNHFNMFGPAYLMGCYSCLSKLSAYIDKNKS